MAHPIHQASSKRSFGDITREQFYQKHNILHQETSVLNNQNGKIFTQPWRPAGSPLSGLVAMIHGYASESSWLFQLTAVAIAKQGFLAISLDLPSHGQSEGPHAHLTTGDPLVSDCIQVFDSARSARPSLPALPAFLYSESLGGAIAMLVALKQKLAWAGLALNGAMCDVSAKFKPVWPLEELLPVVAFFVPKWRVIFTKSLVEKSYNEEWKRELVRNSPTATLAEHPTFATALEFLRVVREVERRWRGEDLVCDSESAELMCELAGSKDKTLKILEGMWHQLVAEPEETVEVGFGIIFD